VDLWSGDEIWVPSVMAMWGLTDHSPAENFWHGMSTGYAIHTDPATALCSALCEVIERDIIEVLWAQMLPLPRLPAGCLSETGRRITEWCSAHFIDVALFDATSDIGVPCVYCVLVSGAHPYLRHVVGCSTGVTFAAAADKAILEAILLKKSLDSKRPHTKENPLEFTEITDGALYTGAPERASAFDFLLAQHREQRQVLRERLPDDPEQRLQSLLENLAGRGMQVIAVDRTPAEFRGLPLHVFCVIVPDLQPMVLASRGRYRGHGRLYSAPALMGYRSLPEVALNPWPQPFA
jgi:ribosomal protein S12 methylthiotransferase accessory factor